MTNANSLQNFQFFFRFIFSRTTFFSGLRLGSMQRSLSSDWKNIFFMCMCVLHIVYTMQYIVIYIVIYQLVFICLGSLAFSLCLSDLWILVVKLWMNKNELSSKVLKRVDACYDCLRSPVSRPLAECTVFHSSALRRDGGINTALHRMQKVS